MSTAQFVALLLCSFCMAALLLGLIRPAWVLPSRRATRIQVLVLYSAASVLVLLLASEFPGRPAHAQSPDDAGSLLNERVPEPESLRALLSRVLLSLGLGPGHQLRVGTLMLSYEDPITEEQAAALGEFLNRSEVGASDSVAGMTGATSRAAGDPHGAGRINVQVRKNQPGQLSQAVYELRIATPFSRRQQLDTETRAAYQMVGLLASGIAFDGAPVQVEVCTPHLSPLLILRPQLGQAAAHDGHPSAS